MFLEYSSKLFDSDEELLDYRKPIKGSPFEYMTSIVDFFDSIEEFFKEFILCYNIMPPLIITIEQEYFKMEILKIGDTKDFYKIQKEKCSRLGKEYQGLAMIMPILLPATETEDDENNRMPEENLKNGLFSVFDEYYLAISLWKSGYRHRQIFEIGRRNTKIARIIKNDNMLRIDPCGTFFSEDSF